MPPFNYGNPRPSQDSIPMNKASARNVTATEKQHSMDMGKTKVKAKPGYKAPVPAPSKKKPTGTKSSSGIHSM